MAQPSSSTRPRIEGEREAEILDHTLSLLIEVGFDKLTLDAVAKQAKASKATLYRRWESKSALVIDALVRAKGAPQLEVPDTGTLRDDLTAMYCNASGPVGSASTKVLGAVITALNGEPEFAAAFREQFIAPKVAISREVYRRAQARGEIRADVDLDLIAPALAGIVMHRSFVLGLPVTPDVVTAVIDQLILPAVCPADRNPAQKED